MKKIISILLSMAMLATAVSCSEEDNAQNTFNGEQFNYFSHVRMEDGLITRDSAGYPIILDYDTMESTILCNVPNCSHTTSSCVALFLKDDMQLPVLYNNCAYYFTNASDFANGEDGKRVLDLSTTIHKYDFNEMEISTIATIEGFNANCYGERSYLIGSEYYFTTNNGDPEYDEAGNVITSTNSGQAKLYSINLDTKKITDYGEIFDYKEYKEQYPSHSIHTLFAGKTGNKFYMRVDLGSISGVVSREVYTFDLETHKIEKYGDRLVECVGEGYLVYYTFGGSSTERDVFDTESVNVLMLENLETGEVTEVDEVTYYGIDNIINGKVWYDTKCYDIEKRKIVEVPQLAEYDFARALAIYNGNYIVQAENEEEMKIDYIEISLEEIDSLFE